MWIEFYVRPSRHSLLVDQYQIDGKDPIPRLEAISTPGLAQHSITRSKQNADMILLKGSIKANV